jgi:hypothetical protein
VKINKYVIQTIVGFILAGLTAYAFSGFDSFPLSLLPLALAFIWGFSWGIRIRIKNKGREE